MGELTRSATSGESPSEPPAEPVQVSSAQLPPRYQWVGELARGGMGRVFVARDLVLKREVAVKEALHGTETALRRFEREALLTARLQHPGIVSVYELARRASGEPYLVMRRVHGQPLNEAISRAGGLRERLALLPAFVSVAETLAYAHREGVIHRDLKPSNVLLGEFGDTVVIDWGLAKDLHSTAADEPKDEALPSPESAALTRAGSVLGTPLYMSPEQARGEPVDRRTDVYALGALLYELLCGAAPYRDASGKATGDGVLHGPPPALLSREPQVPSELATIVGRAMAREPAQRYPDAKALADELKNFQTGRLVQSHTYSTRELLTRWVRRNARPLAVAGAAVIALGVGGAIAVRRVVAERDRANREAAAAERVAKFMTGMFTLVDPSEAKGSTVTAREILDRGARDIETGLAEDPELRARLMKTMGEVYQQLGLYRAAQPLIERAAATSQRELGKDHPETLRLASSNASILFSQGRFADAERVARAALEDQRRALGREDPLTLFTLNTLANAIRDQGRFAEAEALHREAYEARKRVLGPKARATLVSLGNVADDLHEQSKLKEAEQLWLEVLAARREALGNEDRDTAWAMNGLSSTYQLQNRVADAEKLDREALGIRTKILGPDHPDTLQTMGSLANDLYDLGRFPECEALNAKILETRRRVLGAEHPDTLNSLNNHANALRMVGRLKEAEAEHRLSIATRERVLGMEHPITVGSRHALAQVLNSQGRYPEALALLEQVLASQKKKWGPKHRRIGGVYYDLACVQARAGKPDAAFASLDAMLENGLDPREISHLAEDTDLLLLKKDPRYAPFLQRAHASVKP